MEGIWLTAFILQWVILLLLAILMIGVLRYLAWIQDEVRRTVPNKSRFDLGERVSDFQQTDISGDLFAIKSLFGHNKKVLLLFLSATCGPCKVMIEQITELAKRVGGLKALPWSFVLVVQGELTLIKEMTKELPLDELTILVDGKENLARMYMIKSTPFGLALDAQGKLLSQSAQPASNWLYVVLDVPFPVNSPLPLANREPVPILIKEG